MVTRFCHPSTREVEPGGEGVQDYPLVHRDYIGLQEMLLKLFQTSLPLSLSPFLSLSFPPPTSLSHTTYKVTYHDNTFAEFEKKRCKGQTVMILKRIHLETYEKDIPYSGLKFKILLPLFPMC